MRGRVIVVGTMDVAGETMGGLFIEATQEELRAYAGRLLYRAVDVTMAEEQTEEPEAVSKVTCARCGGAGIVEDKAGEITYRGECPLCRGNGYI